MLDKIPVDASQLAAALERTFDGYRVQRLILERRSELAGATQIEIRFIEIRKGACDIEAHRVQRVLEEQFAGLA